MPGGLGPAIKAVLDLDLQGGGSNSIFVCRFCEHFAKKRGWTDINVHKSAHKMWMSWHAFT